MKLPRKVYVIFPFDYEGKVAGVYVGSTKDPRQRLVNHLNDYGAQQWELHNLMRENGFKAYVVDTIDDYEESHIEYDWIDVFKHFLPDLKIFNVRTEQYASWENVKNPASFTFGLLYRSEEDLHLRERVITP